MTERNIRGFGLGLQCGIALVLIFGFFVVVRAVTQGTIQNPAFGPTNNDVKLDIRLSCNAYVGVKTATCLLPDEVLTGGGGDCTDRPKNAKFIPQAGNKYFVDCTGGGGEPAYAICCRVIIQ